MGGQIFVYRPKLRTQPVVLVNADTLRVRIFGVMFSHSGLVS